MSSIKFIAEKLYGGYQPILDYYNKNKPAEAEPLEKTSAVEGGFEIKLNKTELEKHLKQLEKWRGSTLRDYNDTVKQMRFTGNSELTSGGHVGFSKAETKLLFQALQHSLGADQVILM